MKHFKLVSLLLISLFMLISANEKDHKDHTPAANETVSSKEGGSNRKERLNVLSGLSNGLLGLMGNNGGSSSGSSSAPGGTSPSLSIQQGLKGIQSLQKFVSRFQDVVKVPFSFRGVTDGMATMTGLLAAVGGGYLTYVTMVALFGSMLDPSNTAYQHAFSAPPHQYAAPQHLLNNIQLQGSPAQVQGYNRRQSNDHGNLYWGSYDLGKIYQTVTNFNYPEASFKLLRIKDESCKQRAVCEFEKFLAKKGVASVILKGVRYVIILNSIKNNNF